MTGACCAKTVTSATRRQLLEGVPNCNSFSLWWTAETRRVWILERESLEVLRLFGASSDSDQIRLGRGGAGGVLDRHVQLVEHAAIETLVAD